jgi:hypothetical protein
VTAHIQWESEWEKNPESAMYRRPRRPHAESMNAKNPTKPTLTFRRIALFPTLDLKVANCWFGCISAEQCACQLAPVMPHS